MALITYTDKSTFESKPSIPAAQKIQAADMNEIKSVVNTNQEEFEAFQTALAGVYLPLGVTTDKQVDISEGAAVLFEAKGSATPAIKTQIRVINIATDYTEWYASSQNATERIDLVMFGDTSGLDLSFFDSRTVKYGMLLRNFGESNANATNGSYPNLKPTSLIPKVCAPFCLDDDSATASTLDLTGEQPLKTYTLLANTLGSKNQKINVRASGAVDASGSTSYTLKIYFSGVLIFSSGGFTPSVSESWFLDVEIMRSGASTFRANGMAVCNGVSHAISTTDLACSFTANEDVLITGESDNAGDSVFMHQENIMFMPKFYVP